MNKYPQNPDDLLVRDPPLLRLVRPEIGRTPIASGGSFLGRVNETKIGGRLAEAVRPPSDNCPRVTRQKRVTDLLPKNPGERVATDSR